MSSKMTSVCHTTTPYIHIRTTIVTYLSTYNYYLSFVKNKDVCSKFVKKISLLFENEQEKYIFLND